MPGPLRFGGRGQGADGAAVVWSVAEGSKGRRWREVRNVGGGVASSLLLETDAAGRFSHLELSTPSGLLTLHPEPDGTLHGHAIVSDGVEHVEGLAVGRRRARPARGLDGLPPGRRGIARERRRRR